MLHCQELSSAEGLMEVPRYVSIHHTPPYRRLAKPVFVARDEEFDREAEQRRISSSLSMKYSTQLG